MNFIGLPDLFWLFVPGDIGVSGIIVREDWVRFSLFGVLFELEGELFESLLALGGGVVVPLVPLACRFPSLRGRAEAVELS